MKKFFKKYKMEIKISYNKEDKNNILPDINYILYGFSKWYLKIKYYLSGIKYRHNDWGGNPKYTYMGEDCLISTKIFLNNE